MKLQFCQDKLCPTLNRIEKFSFCGNCAMLQTRTTMEPADCEARVRYSLDFQDSNLSSF